MTKREMNQRNKNRIKNTLLVACLLIGYTCMMAPPVQAATSKQVTGLWISINQENIHTPLLPGDVSTVGTTELVNSGSTTERFVLQPTGNLSVYPTHMTLAANQHEDFHVSLFVKENAVPGPHTDRITITATGVQAGISAAISEKVSYSIKPLPWTQQLVLAFLAYHDWITVGSAVLLLLLIMMWQKNKKKNKKNK